MQLFVKDLMGGTTILEVDPSSTIKEVAEKLQEKTGFPPYVMRLVFGGKQLTGLESRTTDVVVVDGSSCSKDGTHQISLDQPLLLFYHTVFRTSYTPSPNTGFKLADDDETACVGGVKIKFHRTTRVPEDLEAHDLPPSFGHFKLFNVDQATCKLPPFILQKGGVFLSMYQREAMGMSFEPTTPDSSHAVKISVGGINVLTGLPQNQTVEGKQDYIVVGGTNGQKCLDEISTTQDVVRQFVAMPLGTRYTAEGQVTGKENTRDIQIEVFKSYGDEFRFGQKNSSPNLNVYQTPRQLGLRHGDIMDLHHYSWPDMTKTLRDYKIEHESMLHLVLRLRNGNLHVPPGADLISGFAAGNQLSQKINRDSLPAWAYDPTSIKRLHLTAINAAHFTQVTGLPSPPSPITPQTYLQLNLPWYSLYDEIIPGADNRDFKSLCGYCRDKLAVLQLSPCGHLFCDDCANTSQCPSCLVPVAQGMSPSPQMPVPGCEDDDKRGGKSLIERIFKLRIKGKGNLKSSRTSNPGIIID